MIVNEYNDVETKIRSCWLGKAIGGTLGAPHEGVPGMMDLDFYKPVPSGALPNDDLDLQVVWACHLLRTRATEVTPDILAEAWLRHVTFPFDEYGVNLRNAAQGIPAAERGWRDNWFGDGMGAAIRSELWACVAPGDPKRAAGFAWADAVVDHSGEGVWAEVFLAALQSAAFEESCPDILLPQAMAFLPEDSVLRAALVDTLSWWGEFGDWKRIRGLLVEKYGTDNFTDVVCNIAFTVLGWLAGKGDFGKSICIAVNCGWDTDCTGATLGALMGIIDPGCIPDKWVAPIGELIVISKEIVMLDPPSDLDAFTAMTQRLARQLKDAHPVLGKVRPRSPLKHEDSLSPIPAQVEAMGSGGSRVGASLPGYWVRFEEKQFGDEGLRLRLAFTLPSAQPVELMVYARGRKCQVKLDGVTVLSLAPDDLVGVAPSFHRGEKAVVDVGTLTPLAHKLVIELGRAPGQDGAELVFGLGDPRTHLWLPGVTWVS